MQYKKTIMYNVFNDNLLLICIFCRLSYRFMPIKVAHHPDSNLLCVIAPLQSHRLGIYHCCGLFKYHKAGPKQLKKISVKSHIPLQKKIKKKSKYQYNF